MSKNKRRLTNAERARIPADAARLLAFLRANARPGITGDTLVRSRPRLAERVGLTVRELGRAESRLVTARAVRVQRLDVLDGYEGEPAPYRWILPYEA